MFSGRHNWRPDRDHLLSELAPPNFHPLQLQRFPRGVDNAHIDVAFDNEMVKSCSDFVRTILRADVNKHFWKQTVRDTFGETGNAFRKLYTELSKGVIKQARAEASLDWLQLYQLGVWKLLLMLVEREQMSLRDDIQEMIDNPARRQSGQSLALHERKVTLAQYAGQIRYRTAKDILTRMARVERSSLASARRSVLGVEWPLALEMLFNPLLQLGGLGEAEDWLYHYGFFLRDEALAARMNRCFYDLFEPWLPEPMMGEDAEAENAEAVARHDQGEFPGYLQTERRLRALVGLRELALEQPHAFDVVDNIAKVLDHPSVVLPAAWEEKRFRRFQAQLRKQLLTLLRKQGLIDDLVASWQLAQIYPELGVLGQAELVYAYLRGQSKRKEVLRRFASTSSQLDPEAFLQRIDKQVKAIGSPSSHELEVLGVEAMMRFVQLRADTKYAWWMYRGMDSLRVLTDPREQAISAANHLLQHYSKEGTDAGQAKVIGHVVIKADVRGSTEMTAQMLARDLNPAAFFSRNLYDPINTLIEEYGAEKVFVEGDAVILAIMQTDGTEGRHHSVARACGLAARMLEVVQAKNAETRRLGLPELELGLGIAYSPEAPAYLYDNKHKIMISSAINRADRLSSCNGQLRAWRISQGLDDVGIEVMRQMQEDPLSGETHQVLVRYNVNGIEIEPAAFEELAQGMQLKPLVLADKQGALEGRYLAGDFQDLRGNSYWLVVREARMPLWQDLQAMPAEDDAPPYYQVITDRTMRNFIRQHLVDA